jgi:serine O-acetyltransferase
MNQFMDKGLIPIIKEDWDAHGKDWTKPGFRAVAVCRFGAWRMGVKSKLFRAPLSLLYRRLFRRVRNCYGIELPYTVKLGRRVVFEHQHGIVIHGEAEIGDDSIIRQGVTIGNRYLERPHEAPCLGRAVNVGAGAVIIGAVTIGDNVNIGSNAVVLEDLPSGSTAVAPKARIINKINES